MKSILLALVSFFSLNGFAQNNSYDPQLVEQVCKNSENSAINALQNLSARTDNFKDLNLEKIRSSYVNSMNFERERIKSIINTPTYQIILDSAEANFKFALCQKLSRPSASVTEIVSELYFLCRKTINTGKEQKPEPCF